VLLTDPDCLVYRPCAQSAPSVTASRKPLPRPAHSTCVGILRTTHNRLSEDSRADCRVKLNCFHTRWPRETRAQRRATVGMQSPEPTHNRNKSCVTIAARTVSACSGAPVSQLLGPVETIQSQQFQLRRAGGRTSSGISALGRFERQVAIPGCSRNGAVQRLISQSSVIGR